MSETTARELQGLMDEPDDKLVVWHRVLANISVQLDAFIWHSGLQLPTVITWIADARVYRALLLDRRTRAGVTQRGFDRARRDLDRSDRFVRISREGYTRPIANVVAELVAP